MDAGHTGWESKADEYIENDVSYLGKDIFFAI